MVKNDDDDGGSFLSQGERGRDQAPGPMAGGFDAVLARVRLKASTAEAPEAGADRMAKAVAFRDRLRGEKNLVLEKSMTADGEPLVKTRKLDPDGPDMSAEEKAEGLALKPELLELLAPGGGYMIGMARRRRGAAAAEQASKIPAEAVATIIEMICRLPGANYRERLAFGTSLGELFAETDKDHAASVLAYTRHATLVANREVDPEALAEAIEAACREANPGRSLIERCKLLVGDTSPARRPAIDPLRPSAHLSLAETNRLINER